MHAVPRPPTFDAFQPVAPNVTAEGLVLKPIAIIATIAAVAVGAGVALADSAYHSTQVPVEPVAGQPLRSGFVENIHANGPNVYAHEVYVLNGATSNATFQVVLVVYPFDPACSGAPVAIPTAWLATNEAGNGKAEVVLAPEAATGLRGATHGVLWRFVDENGAPAYATACSAVALD